MFAQGSMAAHLQSLSPHWDFTLWFSYFCVICMVGIRRIKCISHFSPLPCTAIHSTLHLLKLGSPPPHKEARQRRKELRRKLLAEQEELERQMKELQAANENKQQELETVRKVGARWGCGGRGSPQSSARARAAVVWALDLRTPV